MLILIIIALAVPSFFLIKHAKKQARKADKENRERIKKGYPTSNFFDFASGLIGGIIAVFAIGTAITTIAIATTSFYGISERKENIRAIERAQKDFVSSTKGIKVYGVEAEKLYGKKLWYDIIKEKHQAIADLKNHKLSMCWLFFACWIE
jgi:preprotein translocase subunit YajC